MAPAPKMQIFNMTVSARLLRKIQRVGQVSHAGPRSGKGFEMETTSQQFDDRRRIVLRAVDVALLRIRRDDERGNARPRSPAIAPGRRDVIPESAVLVVSNDDHSVRPL